MIEERLCGSCGHPAHWRACRAAGNGRLVDGCYCRRRGPHSDAPQYAEPFESTTMWCEYHGIRHSKDAHAKMKRGEDWR